MYSLSTHVCLSLYTWCFSVLGSKIAQVKTEETKTEQTSLQQLKSFCAADRGEVIAYPPPPHLFQGGDVAAPNLCWFGICLSVGTKWCRVCSRSRMDCYGWGTFQTRACVAAWLPHKQSCAPCRMRRLFLRLPSQMPSVQTHCLYSRPPKRLQTNLPTCRMPPAPAAPRARVWGFLRPRRNG